ncbi:MAG TPA: PSD1 and planctomycete cytochrome C domain-containing protein [Bryobacteraceae bacterium]|jgi:mono/diheme cytochrome c family protein
MTLAACFTRILAVSVTVSASFALAQAAESTAAPPAEVKAIIDKSCLGCHGPSRQMANLRLDTAGAIRKLVTPGKPDASTLFQRVAGVGLNPDQARMPLGGKLADNEIATIRTWISSIQQETHWAWIPPKRPALPPVQNAKWARNPIDHFILARLEKEGLSPSPEADRSTLLRRLSLDLIGLPPTPQELAAFAADRRPDAYDREVERLLASPHYGERWGRHWLDAARYADSDGYEKDKQRFAWFYRDWVINAFNENLPYDRFVIEQVAGDLLPHPSQSQLVATGFLRNSMLNEEGGIDPEQFRMEAMFDRIDAISKAVLGVTVNCAQCHNHKFDPILQTDYYRMMAFLNNAHEANISVYTPEEQVKRADIFRRIHELEDGLKHRNPDWESRMQAWVASFPKTEWTVIRPVVDVVTDGGERYEPLDDGSFLPQGYAPTKSRVKLTTKTDLRGVTAIRLELMLDPNLPRGGPGRSIYGTAALTEFEAEVAPVNDPKKITKIKFVRATADVNPPETELLKMYDDKSGKRRVTGPIDYAIDGKDETAWGTDNGPGLRNQPRQAVFVASEPFGFEGGTVLSVFLKQNHGGWNSDDNQNHNLGRFRLSITTDPNAIAQPALTFSNFRQTVADWKDANDAIAAIWREHPEGTTQLILSERNKLRETHLLTRGDFLKPAQVVEPGVPAFLNPFPVNAPRNRLGFAEWLVARDSPTTARAFVNRMWQSYFGTGIVATSEDLGRQADAPSHPQLLDWLAVEFMDHGWDIKHMHRLIVTSAAYRQNSSVSPALLEKDPYDRLISRGPRFRVDAEIVRDIALAASGLLNDKIGGPAVYPPAPRFLFEPPVSYGPKIWNEETGANRYRRGIYIFRYRSVPYPMLQNFDAPIGETACVRRSRSDTPLQALTTLNEPVFNEAAEALASHVLAEGGKTDRDKLNYAMLRVVARKPTDDESQELLSFLSRHDWIALSRVLLNLDETITKE